MKKKTPEQELKALCNNIRQEIDHWEHINQNGCNDPGYADGTNMNLTRNHDYVGASERLAEYEDTGLTPPEIMELKERDKPKLVVYEHEFEDNRLISYVQRCESCGEAYDPSERFNFCPNCGQRILRRKED